MSQVFSIPRHGRSVMIVGLCLILLSCQTAPMTGRSQIILIDEPQEVALGIKAYQVALSKAKRSTDVQKTALVQRVGKRIAAVANRPDYAWEFTLVQDDKMVNAFAMPGGKVAVYTGILPVAEIEAGLATVMSHEVAHAIARHGGERMTTGLLAQMGMTALNVGLAVKGEDQGTIQAFNTAYGLGTQFGILLPFSRNQESEADHIGLILMARAGYDPKEAIGFWQRMAQTKKATAPEWLTTHPSDDTRIRQLRALLPEAEKEYQRIR